jgi:transposase-like protein
MVAIEKLAPLTPELIDRWRLKSYPPHSKLTPEIAAAVLENIARGNYIEIACQAAGIGAKTLRNWRDRGERDDEAAAPYREFVEALEQARALGHTFHIGIIARAARENWTASAWILERTDPARYGRHERVTQSGDMQHTLKVVFGDVPQRRLDDNQDIDVT